VLAYLKRLVTAGAAYQAGDLLAKVIAVFTLPLYTRYVTAAAYGVAETLLTSIILVSILLRLGVGEAFVRFHFDDEDADRRDRLAAGTVAFVAVSSSLAAVLLLTFAGPVSEALLGFRDPWLLSIATLGLWAFTNLETAYSLLRVHERAGTYLRASVVNVVLSVGLTAFLVVVEHQGARGLLGGNFAGTGAVLLGLWWVERARLLAPIRARAARAAAGAVARAAPEGGRGRPALRRMLAFGLPTVPVDATVYALQVIDRAYLYRVQSPVAAGLYALAVKLATVVFVAVRGFQYAWPPLAYSVRDDAEAARLYSLVTTYYVLATGTVVTGVALLGRWLVRLLAAPKFYDAHLALPWLAFGWALYGLYLVFVVIAGRARMTVRVLPAAVLGLAVNVVGLVVLVPAWGIAGAGVALCAAYAAMLVAIYLLTRRLFSVGFEWGRLARLAAVLGGVAVAGELTLPTSGLVGLVTRAGALALVPVLLVASGFLRPGEVDAARGLVRRLRRRA
jgi:O-antigen/teichoic acid export membrane protein